MSSVDEIREGLSTFTLGGQGGMARALYDLLDLLDAIYAAAQVDRPDEGKHELAVRIMRMIRP